MTAGLLKLNPEAKRNLHWSSVDGGEVVWFGGADVDPDGNLVEPDGRKLGNADLSTGDVEFTLMMRSVVLQTVLALTYRPDLLEAEVTLAPSRPGRRPNPRASNPVLKPRWLGTGLKKQAQSAVAGSGEHSSPQAHWRRGHWRRIPVGPRDQQGRKWTWIQPTFVNG